MADNAHDGILRFALRARRLPPLTDALYVGDLARANALRRADGHGPEVIARLRGASGGRRLTDHRHCHFLSTDEDGDGRLDHLTIWCPEGLRAPERAVLSMPLLRSSRLREGPIELIRVPVLPERADTSVGPVARARLWLSHTPFLSVRHPRHRPSGVVDGYPAQVQLELRRRDLPEALDVAELPTGTGGRWASFRRDRPDRSPSDGGRAFGYTLSFREPVAGPIALGRFSHFGMGLFLPKG